MTASFRQRQQAADALRAGSTKVDAALAADIGLSTLKRWLTDDAEFQAMVVSSPDIRPGRPPRLGKERGVPASQRDLRCRLWLAADGEVLGSYIPPLAFETAGTVLHVHLVPPEAVDGVVASIGACAYPADSPYIAVPLAGLDDLFEHLPLVCRLASADPRESLAAWLELWMFVDEEGRTRTLAESLWQGQRRFLEALVGDGHVLSIKSRKVGLGARADLVDLYRIGLLGRLGGSRPVAAQV